MKRAADKPTETPQRRRRASKACSNCHKRKTKCDYDKAIGRCSRCQEEKLQCTISDIERRGGYSNVLAGKEKQFRRRESQVDGIEGSARVASTSSDESVLGLDLYNPTDALDILQRVYQDARVLYHDSTPTAASVNAADEESLGSLRRLPMQEAAIVIDGILSVSEAERFVTFFFAEIAPFYASLIPQDYQDLSRIAAEPALLAVVCTIGARCLDEERFRDLHVRLWTYCRQTLSALLWECAPRDLKSLVFAVITLTEWFPSALIIPNTAAPGEALRKYTRICWPLMGQVVRLARHGGLVKHDIQATIALHFTDQLIACRIGQQPMLHQINSEEDFPQSLVRRCTLHDRARLDIVKLLHMANGALYRSRSETRALVSSGRVMTILELHHQLALKWRMDYQVIVKGGSWLDRTIMYEYHHFELSVFALVLIPWQNAPAASKLQKHENFQLFLDIAVDAARAIIEHESWPERPVELRYSPIQWITRLLHASVFLAKALLLKTVFTTETQRLQTVRLLSLAAGTLAQIPPDDQRIFSRPLETICRRFSPGGVRKPHESPHIQTEGEHAAVSERAVDQLFEHDLLGHMFDIPDFDTLLQFTPGASDT